MKKLIIVALLGASGMLTGCAANSVKPVEFGDEWERSSAQVDLLIKEGKPQDALKVLDDTAKKSPDRKEPWARKARIHFEAKEYSRAILSAEEVLQRDPADRDAKGIRAASGLRVAQQSLSDLRKEAGLKGDAQKDAVELVKILRDIVGDKVVVPAAGPAPAARPAAASQPCGKKRPCRPAGGNTTPSPQSGAAGGPFGALQ
ncbi:tetratricopeptide repeat protein [Zoogloea sp.]|uniref:tetratricopeptide repeat protein n=1 Tax=Zoogloea sp. TaxID=49181 RepID=UPI0035B1B71B